MTMSAAGARVMFAAGVAGADVCAMGSGRGRAAALTAEAGVAGAAVEASRLSERGDVSAGTLSGEASAAARCNGATDAPMATSDGADAGG